MVARTKLTVAFARKSIILQLVALVAEALVVMFAVGYTFLRAGTPAVTRVRVQTSQSVCLHVQVFRAGTHNPFRSIVTIVRAL